MREYSEQCDFTELFLLALQGEITPEQMKQFDLILSKDPEKIRAYVELLEIHTELSSAGSIEVPCEVNDSAEKYDTFLQLLANEENTAPEMELPEEEPQRELIRKVVYPPREKRKLSKFNMVFLAMNAAAILLFFLFLRFAPSNGSIEVATLTDSINAKWADYTTSFEKGARLVTGNERLLLREGYAELVFDTNVRVVIEAPAEFQILAEDRIGLNYGKIYSWVPKEAIGFSVLTHNAKIIDMGTEFGIDVDSVGSIQLHVLQGKTILIAGDKLNKVSVEVSKGAAKKVTADNHIISDISCNDRLFVREIDSAHKFVWRGETAINLADIVGGGNGFDSGQVNAGIDVATGKMISDLPTGVVQAGSVGYQAVNGNPFIDGVFVPGMEDGKTSITADGSISVEFPRTSGYYWGYLFNGAFHEGDKVPRHTLRLNGIPIGTSENPSISIHSNQGITFDLSKIRQNTPMGKITEFRSLIGISETVKNYVNEARMLDAATLSTTTFSTVDFWVFVDGRKVYELEMSNTDKPVRVEIPVSDQDRFLTLAVTEADTGWAFDWALFARPELVIEPIK